MKILVTYGSKLGGTEGLAAMVGDELRQVGFDVDVRPTAGVTEVADYDAVIVGGALYANRWHRDAARFVRRHRRQLRGLPVWLFSSGPLDGSAETKEIAPVGQVRKLMRQVDAAGHQTFGGRLAPDATGLVVRSMAKRLSGDWRSPVHVARWTAEIVDQLARTGHQPAR
jgi:menaquinone-dependent protoporphyrinogen oxidase